MQTELEITIRSMGLRKSILWTESDTQEEIYRYCKILGVTALSCAAITCSTWLVVSTASPVLFEMFISGLSAGGFAWLKLIWQEAFEGDVDLMNYAKIFGLHFLAGAIAGGGALCFTAGITGICCASIPAAHVTYFQYVLSKVVSRALDGFASSVASDVQKVYFNGFETKFKQIVGNALQKAAKLGFIGMISGLLSIAVNKYFEDFSMKKEEYVREGTVPFKCNLFRKATEKITETALDSLDILKSYFAMFVPYAKSFSKHVLSYMWNS